tara:strand:+ start:397 stop:762 length:366 start_codon:yes stop_codon:yes gene_type:complete
MITGLLLISLIMAPVSSFKDVPVVTEVDGKEHVGILVSEDSYRKFLQLKIDSDAKIAECNVDKKVCTQVQETYKLSIKELKAVVEKRDSWFSRNRGSLGLVTGLLIGTGLSVGIVHAVYQK